MVSEALDGLTDEQLADLELQESGLVSGQNEGAIASTAFAQRTNPQPAPAPEPEEPVALSDYELNKLEEENYRRIDYVMTPQEFDQYWDRREKEDNEVGRFLDGLGQGAAGLIGMVPEAGRELQGAMVGMVTDPVNQMQRNVQTGAEIVRKGGINLVQLFDWVSNKVDDLATGSKRAEAINAGIRSQLQSEGRLTGNREQDEQIYQAALAEARKAGAYTPTADQVREDRGKAYERYTREKALERDFANVSEFKTGESQMSAPTSAEAYQITGEQPMPTLSTLGSMAVDPLNALPLGAGALSKARVLRRIANLSEKPLQGAERVASGLADVAERVELGISTRLQDITGLTQKQQAALGAGVAGTAVYVDSATEGGGGITKAVLMAGAVMPALHYGGGLLRKVGSAAGGAATIVREAGVGGLGVARAEAASSLAGNAAVPERYRKFFTGYVDGTDSTLKRVAQDAGNPEALRRVSRFADRMGATQVARVADDAVSGAVTAGIVGSPFAALQPDAERAGEVMGGILALGAAGGVAGGVARRAGTAADADIARMFADVQAVGGNVEAFARLPHATLDRLAAMQGVLAGKVDFVPLTGDEYRMNADIAQNGGEATAGVFLDRDANNRARVFINLDGKTATDAIAPHEIGHAILTSSVLDGQPRNDLRNLVNQQYGPDGVEARGREYIARMVDADLRQGVTGEAPTVLTEAEMKAVEGGKTMDDIVADRAKDPAERDRLINERMEEFRQRSIDKGEDALDWARDEIIAETFASEAPAIDFRAIRRDAMFPRLAESMLSAGGRVLEVFGANLSSTGKLMDNPSVLFRDNPLFQDRIMQKRVREYVRSYDQYLAGLEEAGAKELRGVELARSSKPEDLARSTHVKLRDEGRGVLENDFLFQKPDGTYSLKPQKIITATENARSAQIKTLYDARKFVPVNSQEFGKRKVNGREVIGGPVLPPQFDLFTNFPKHVREFARQMERSREEGGSWDIDYNAIGTGASGRYRVTNLGNVRAIQRETVPYGWIVTKANHLLAASLDLNAFRASAMKAINKGDLGLFNNDMRQVEADLKTYLANHRNGRPGEMTIGQQKRDMLNGLIGTGTAVQRTANPLYSDLNPRGSIRTWRVDRLNDAKPTGRTGYFFDYDKINNNRMPSAVPQAGMAMPDAPANLSTDQILRELEENQGYLGLSTLGMREGRPVKGGAQQTRELLKRNTALNEELRRRGGPQEESDVARVLRQRGQAMPDGSQPMRGQAMADVGSAADDRPRRLIDMPQSALKVLHADSAELPKPSKKLTNATVALTLADVAEKHNNGIITSSNITPEQKSDLMILGADEAEAALKASGKNAGNWYSVAIEAALGIAGVIYRELSDIVAARSHAVLAKESDPVKAGQFALRLPLAITSQNMTVKLNTRASNEQFNIFLKTGKFDPSIAYGEKAKSISGNLDLANVMIEELGSVLALEDFVSREFTVRELEAEASKIAGRSIKIAGRKDDIVNGAAIFGPKIGQGFLQNLMGKFDPVTIDLWMRRTWGRWTGDVVGDGVTAQRLARLIDQSRKAGRKLPESIKRLRTTMRSMGETKTGKAKKPELTMSEDVEARLEADTAFRKDVEAFAKEVNAEFQGMYKMMSDVMSPALAKKVQDAIQRAERMPDQADAILSDVYNVVIREQSRIKQQLDKKWSALPLEKKKEMTARQSPEWANVKPSDRAQFIKKSKPILKGAWLEMQHQAEGRTAKLDNPQKNLIKPAWANAAKSIVSELNPIDIPSDMDRRVITEVVNGIREELERRGYTVTNADVQAILWYPEKDLWAKLRGEEESILKQSYDDEFINIAEGLGLGLEARKVAKQIRGY